MGATLNPIDILLSLVLILAIAAMLGWTVAFRSRQFVWTRPARNTGRVQSILVAVNGSAESGRAVDLACGLAVDKGARIILAHVIEVPLRYPISASLPQLEQKAEGALRSAALRVKESHLEYETRIVRDRTFAGGLVLLARDAQADMVVVGFDGLFQRGLSDLVVVSELFRHAPCEVLVAREPIPLDEDGFRMGRLIEPSVHV